MKTNSIIEQKTAEWIDIRRDIHAHPELRFEEIRTAGLVADRLRALGLEVTEGVGKTGVVGLLRGHKSSTSTHRKAIGLRADMDALPIQEKNLFPHASTFKGKMHACGHDGHVAMLLGAAEVLATQKLHFEGDVVFIFQPAEEGGAGAQRMIEDGLFVRFPVDAVFAMHNWPGLPVGTFAVRKGPMMASSNEFELTIKGKGAHAAMPHLGIDPVPIACQIILAFQQLISRVRNPLDPAVISVTQINAGDAINVIPEFATLAGTVRTFKEETLDLIEAQMGQIAQHLCASFGAQSDFSFNRRYPPLINDSGATTFIQRVLVGLEGVDQVYDDLDPTMGAEDFAFMLKVKPGSYVWLGNGDGDHRAAGHGLGPCMLHNPSYDFNDEVLSLGVRAWVALGLEFLNGGAQKEQ
jgi:hippurate hydrolase